MKQRKIIVPPISLQNDFEEFCKQVDKSKVIKQSPVDTIRKAQSKQYVKLLIKRIEEKHCL